MADFDKIVEGEGYLAKHWRGHLSLTKSFWINLIGIGFVCLVIRGAVNTLVEASSLGELGVTVRIATVAVDFLIWLWSAVGVCRSAERYTRQRGSGIWGNVATTFVVFQGIALLYQVPHALD